VEESHPGELKDMGVREEFQDFLRRHGHIVYLAIQTSARCICYDPVLKEPKPGCPNCLGTGHVVELHRVLAYSVRSPQRPSQPNSFRLFEPGEHSPDTTVYYLEVDPKVKSGDLLIEPIRKNGRFLGIAELYQLSFPYLYRMEDDGIAAREIYIRVGARQIPSNKKAVEAAIRKRFSGGTSS